MNIAARTELMQTLTEISRIAPYVRLGQLVCLLTDRAEHDYTLHPVADIEDEELLPSAKRFLENMRRLDPESHADQIRAHLESEEMASPIPLTASLNTQSPPAVQPV